MAEPKSYFRKSAASSLLNTLVSALSTGFLLPAIIRQVGLDAYGIWAVIGVFVGITSILDLGMWKSLVYLILKERFSYDELISSAVLLAALVAGGFAVAVVVAMLLGAPIFGSVLDTRDDLAWWLASGGCVVVLASLFANVARGALEASFRGHVLYVGFALVTLLQYGVASLASRVSRDPRALIVGSVLVYLAILVLHAAYLWRIRRVAFVSPTRRAVLAILKYGMPTFVADLPVIFLGPTLLYLFVLTANSAGEYAIFDIALKIATLAASAVSMLAMPIFAISAATRPQDHEVLRALVARYLRVTSCVAIIGCGAYWLIGDQMLSWLFTEQPDSIFQTSLTMLLGTAASAALEPIARTLLGMGVVRKLAIIRCLTFAVTVLLVLATQGMAPLQRFSMSVGIGYAAGALGLLALYVSDAGIRR